MIADDLPCFDEMSGTDDSGPVYTETMDLGELGPLTPALSEVTDQVLKLPESIHKLLHSLPIPAMLISSTASIVFMNQSWRKVTNRYKKIRGSSILSLFPRASDAKRVQCLLEQVIVHRTPQSCEGMLKVEGVRKWCRLSMRSVRFGDERAILALLEDLTLERKQLVLISKQQKELQAARNELEKRIIERTAELRAANTRLRSEITERRRAELQLRKAHGDLERRVAERTVELTETNRKLLQEIAERKNAEEKLSLAAKVIQNSNEAIVISDSLGRIVEVNDSFSEVTGYSPEEIIGKSPLIMHAGFLEPHAEQEIRRTVNETGHWQGEMTNRRKNGETYPVLLSISAVTNDDGEVTHYVRIFTDIANIKQAEERLHHLAHYDSLTGLPNRILFQDRLEQSMREAERDETSIVLMLLDLDGFKNVNDTFGHKVGDELLTSVGHRISMCVRGSDTVARLGGDEFTVLLRNVTDLRGAAKVARSIVETLARPFRLDRRELFITTSIGITSYPADADHLERLLQNADTALYHAKQQGKNNFQFFSEEMNVEVLERLTLELDLRAALERQQFALYYQPIISFETGQMISAEALLRWNHPTRGLLEPHKFISLAEETGQIVPIGEWVFRSACAQLRDWQEAGFETVPVSINVSGLQLKQQDFTGNVRQILDETGVMPSYVEIELTESFAERDPERTIDILREIRSYGIGLSIDDFGTGYSSLSYLKRFPIDKLKIDRSFVKDIASDPDDTAIVEAIVGVAHGLKLEVVAEGVESPEQLRFLRAHGCDAWQGFCFAHPLPADAFVQLFSRQCAPVPRTAVLERLGPPATNTEWGIPPPGSNRAWYPTRCIRQASTALAQTVVWEARDTNAQSRG